MSNTVAPSIGAIYESKKAVHAALSRLVIDASTAYPPDDGPLTKKQVAALRKDAKKRSPIGNTTSKNVLFVR